ncbi:MAG TPA: DUF1501 domain-containing protein [Urbifossiella sp.]|jgi:uncharacterized protein (DUF1501 family)|nr:DUF1501 domain-containing protein [Urbifossiella sp.]
MPTDPSRRDFLRATAAGAAGLALAPTAAASPQVPLGGTAKACIFINLIGGPSHLDTFDPKPDAPSDVRGPFAPIPTRVPGVYLSELFPKLAGLADQFSLIRSLHHAAPPIHEAGLQLLNTGRLFRDGPAWPNIGSVVEYLAPAGSSYPTLHINGDVETGIAVGKGFTSGWLPVPVCWGEFDRPEMGTAPWNAPARYGASALGRACHFASTLLACGTTRFASVNHFDTVFDAPSWDCHADRGSLGTTLDDYRTTVAPSFDTAFSALLADLDAQGLLDTTLVVAVGEFGRTPKLNANGGRDHWAGCWTALVAGGGVKGGRVIGASDATGSEPADRPATPQDLVATVFHAFGVPAAATIPGPDGAPASVYPAAPVAELF